MFDAVKHSLSGQHLSWYLVVVGEGMVFEHSCFILYTNMSTWLIKLGNWSTILSVSVCFGLVSDASNDMLFPNSLYSWPCRDSSVSLLIGGWNYCECTDKKQTLAKFCNEWSSRLRLDPLSAEVMTLSAPTSSGCFAVDTQREKSQESCWIWWSLFRFSDVFFKVVYIFF